MPEQFDGIVSIAATPGGTPVITLDGATGDISVGAKGRDGDLVLRDNVGNPRVVINAQDGTLVMKDANGVDSVRSMRGSVCWTLAARATKATSAYATTMERSYSRSTRRSRCST